MKKLLIFALALIMVMSFAACNDNGVGPASSSSPGSGVGGGNGSDEDNPPVPTPTEAPIPPDSIWTLKGEVSFRQVVEEGYYADYTVELDFVKLQGAYPSGQYTGDVYMKLKLDTADFIKEMLKNVPKGIVDINFDLEGYGLRNAIPINVFTLTEFRKEGTSWPSMHTKNANGEQVSPGEEEYVADTSFLMAFATTGSAGGKGNTGGGSFKLGDFDLSGESDGSFKIRVIIEPDSVWGNDFYAGTGGTRKVQIFIDAGGVEFSGTGTLERQPNGETNQQKQINRTRLGEKHNVDETN